MADYYKILGVSPEAGSEEIRKAYFRLARERHPDRFPDPEERRKAEAAFAQLSEAWNTLGNERSRADYDAQRAKPEPTDPAKIADQAYKRAGAALEAGDLEQAVELLRTAIYHAPEQAKYQAALGKSLARDAGRIREAVQALETAARLEPRNARHHADLARVLLSQGLKTRARRSAENALRLAPQDPDIRSLAAELGAGAGEAPTSAQRKGGGLGGLLRRKP
jgi:curved DNA-binding protein CbpA